DSDCKDGRICTRGRCTDVAGGATVPGRSPGSAHEPQRWSRGGPAGLDASQGVGPTTAPKVVWDVDLGAVIFARPALHPRADGASLAYVGTHAGRFVGVVVDGDAAGDVALDLELGGVVWATAFADDRGWLHVGADTDTLFAIDPGAREIVWSRRLGDCEPPRAP